MALLTILWFFLFIIFTIVNGEFLRFEGQCPTPTPTKESTISSGNYYAIAETKNETTRSDMHLKLQRRGAGSIGYDVVDEFRISDDSDEDCVHIKGLLRTVKKDKGKFYIVDGTEDDKTGSLGPTGTRINYLTRSITFLCYNSQEEEGVFYGKVVVLRRKPEEFDDEQRKKIENVLKSNKLDFFNEYLSPVAQKNPCSNEEKK